MKMGGRNIHDWEPVARSAVSTMPQLVVDVASLCRQVFVTFSSRSRVDLLVSLVHFLTCALCLFILKVIVCTMAETRKPDKLYATHPKNYGKGSRPCRVTGRNGGMGLIRKYGINMKRQVFRERAIDMGWMKYN
jgi:small subunit ribosomal protein S29e